jgi:hypothetical protein
MPTRHGPGRISTTDILDAIRTNCDCPSQYTKEIKKFNLPLESLAGLIDKVTDILTMLFS